MTPSADYDRALQLSAEQHAHSKTYSGMFLRPHRGSIKTIIERLDCRTILDYGCGKGKQYDWVAPDGMTLEEYWEIIPVAKYDPAFPPFATEPNGTFDLVICTHVLGIIPIPDLEWVVDRLFTLANKALYIVLNTGGEPSAKKARWRVSNIPQRWDGNQWMNLLKARKAALKSDVEVTFIARPKNDVSLLSGRFVF